MPAEPRKFHVRRKEREITDPEAIHKIIATAKVCHLGLIDEDEPYVVPVNYGWDGKCIYFHSAKAGRKVDIISHNNRVCFNIVGSSEIIAKPAACDVKYRSVTGRGVIVNVTDEAEKRAALAVLMRHSLGYEYPYADKTLSATLVYRIDIEELKGKQGG